MTENEDTGLYTPEMISRREAILRVTVLLGGVALVGGTALLTGCRGRPGEPTRPDEAFTPFTADEIAYLDEIADTILPETSTPGAKAAKTGAFMALIVTDSYSPRDRKVFRDGHEGVGRGEPEGERRPSWRRRRKQRLALLETVDREQKAQADARNREAQKKSRGFLSDQRKEAPGASDAPARRRSPPTRRRTTSA